MGKWVVVGTSSARTVDEAEANGQRFVAEEVAEKSPVGITASLSVWAASLIRGFGEQGSALGRRRIVKDGLS